MNTCIKSSFKCTFEVFKAKVMEDELSWSQFVDNYQIAKVDEHNAIMLMNVLDFEAMEAFMTTDEMKAWDTEHEKCGYAASLVRLWRDCLGIPPIAFELEQMAEPRCAQAKQ